MSPALAQRARAAGERLRVAASARGWQPYSRLFLVGDGAPWSISEDVRAMSRVANQLRIPVASWKRPLLVRRQCVFYMSHFALLDPATFDGGHRLAVAYLHGRPRADEPIFEQCLQALSQHRAQIARVQVSHAAMRDLVLERGVDPHAVFQIPIGIDLAAFPYRSRSQRDAVRTQLDIPATAVVVGSFQKDGVGWEDGSQPKLIKGPDVLLDVLTRLRAHVPELMVLLSGPARGYVRRGLERCGVPYRHTYVSDARRMGELYQALDLYLVTSRDEGGPKAVLEALASGVPLVSTRVGQASDLIEDGQNGWLVDVEDVEGLVARGLDALQQRDERVLAGGRRTAEAHTYDSPAPALASVLRRVHGGGPMTRERALFDSPAAAG